MMMTPAIAESIARLWHGDQSEKYGGAPYAEHLARVAALVDDPDDKVVAWLHDTLEDTDLTFDGLLASGVPESLAKDVVMLTRDKWMGQSYSAYIDRVESLGSPRAIRVKAADLRDHLRSGGPELPVSMVDRYRKALARLESAGNK